jgi:preprotein translocase subunit SecD
VSLRTRILLVLAGILWLGWFVLGSFYTPAERKGTWWLPENGLRLGLDLQGGVHIVIGPDLAVATEHELSAIQDGFERGLEREKTTGVTFERTGQELRIRPPTPDAGAAVRKLAEDDSRFTLREDGADLVLVLNAQWADEVRERAMLQALEVLRRRIDDPQTGIPESVITRQGRDRILIEIPGVDRVPDIFRKTGFLEFKIVQDKAPSEDLLKAKYKDGLPPGTEIAVEKERKTERVLAAYLVPIDADINGDFLTDAQVQFDNRVNEWQVTFTWSAEGGQIFGELTEKNIGKPLAIILDDHVYSDPVIRDRISRQGQISGRFSSEEARDLAIVLRAGALPIPVKIEEERTIGPALGQDSIQRGIWASVVSFVLVVALTIGYYRLSGAYASLALIVNMVMLVGLMALFEGTLTMPGIAGLVLTVGMAVDANVIIFERIREELRAGRTPRAAIAAGFTKAGRTILDANVTNMITAVVLFEYGTGPIKGFAVTLSVGILTSVFAALIVTRILYELYPGNRSVTELSV